MDKGNEQKTQNYIYIHIVLRFIIILYYICHATVAGRWTARRGVGREFTTIIIIIIISVVLYIIMYEYKNIGDAEAIFSGWSPTMGSRGHAAADKPSSSRRPRQRRIYNIIIL